MAFSARIITSLTAAITNPLDLTTPESRLEPRYAHSWADGAGAGQANKVFSDRRQVAFGVTDSLDLAGVLTAPLGGTLTFTAIKEILIVAAGANAGNLLVGEGISNAFEGPFGAEGSIGLLVPPGGILHLRNPSAGGWTVTAGTGDLLPVENMAGSGTATYDIILIGI